MKPTRDTPTPDGSSERSAAWLREQLGRVGQRVEQFAEDRRQGYREAASVLAVFKPWDLQPVGDERPRLPGEALMLLASDAVAVGQLDGQSLWALKADIRHETLRGLRSRERMQLALDANPSRIDHPVQTMFERVIRYGVPPLEKQTTEELQACLVVTGWLEGVIDELPSSPDVRARLERGRFRESLERLGGRMFAGREPELRRLSAFVGTAQSSTDRKVNPLRIVGPGGVGKSSLMAKFTLDHTFADGPHLPVANLDFDSPRLAIHVPETLLGEAVRQLSIQFPDHHRAASALAGSLGVLAASRTTGRERSVSDLSPFADDSLADLHQANVRSVDADLELQAIQSFAQFVTTLIGDVDPRPPFVLILDTFEEVQYRNREQLDAFWTWIERLANEVHGLRVIVSGRSDIDLGNRRGLPDPIELTGFDRASSIAVLRNLGVDDDAVLDGLAQQLKGNPLSLVLAAEIWRTQGRQAIGRRGVKLHKLKGRFLSEARIQGVLYERILDHIHDGDVRALAHPGLALRRLTPEVILDVLAKPCGLDVPDIQQANKLFTAFAREVSLVVVEPDGSLRHRSDVRRLVLDLQTMDKEPKVAAIHAAAVSYYWHKVRAAEGAGLVAPAAERAELIYHTLMTREDPTIVDRLWDSSVESLLAPAFDEFPPGGRWYLASKLKRRDELELREKMDLDLWEHDSERRALAWLYQGDAAAATGLIRQRTERSPNSPLNFVEVLAAAIGSDWELVANKLDRALDEAVYADDRRTQMGLHVVQAHAEERAEAYAIADGTLEFVAALADEVDDAWTSLAARVARLQVSQHLKPTDQLEDLLDDIRAEVASRLRLLTVSDIHADTDLVRAAVAEVAAVDRDLFVELFGIVGLGALDAASRTKLAETLERACERDPELRSIQRLVAAATKLDDDASWTETLETADVIDRADEYVSLVLDGSTAGFGFVAALGDVLKRDQTWSLYPSFYRRVTEQAYEATFVAA